MRVALLAALVVVAGGAQAASPSWDLAVTSTRATDTKAQILLVDVASGATKAIATGYNEGANATVTAVWSPDVTRIAYASGTGSRRGGEPLLQIFVVAVAGGTPRQLTTQG